MRLWNICLLQQLQDDSDGVGGLRQVLRLHRARRRGARGLPDQ